ncbi:hypothetical protein NDI54_20930 [Haloarcula sp. S1AR25-5A]|uniref:Uncharacterized protein n=1 Tax=Haloarcula terrestris TaxID=2950533 RepID=A0AAE4F108_9EURY|nr:hypothetical protein [Haloarcula terrestris]MDS0223796.1 hypothetical protein [Haloarcula terrestris]
MSDSDIPDETVFVADNVDEFVERTRHRQILDAKERAGEALRKVGGHRLEAHRSGQPDHEAERLVREMARSAVESYVLECEALFQGTPEGNILWDEAPIAEFTVGDALGLEHRDIDAVEVNDGIPRDSAESVQVVGVGQYPDLGGWVDVTYEETLNRRGSPTTEETTRLELTVPVDVSREAYRATNTLLTALDLGVKTGEKGGEVDGEYSDLLDDLDK